jgi:hypothetical protein
MTSFPCRFCGNPLRHRVVDLGMSPLCESYLPADRLTPILCPTLRLNQTA